MHFHLNETGFIHFQKECRFWLICETPVLLYHFWLCLAEIVYRPLESAFSLPWTCSWWLSFRHSHLSIGWLGHGRSNGLLLYSNRIPPSEWLSPSRKRLPTTRILVVDWVSWPSYGNALSVIPSSSPCSLSVVDMSLVAIWFSFYLLLVLMLEQYHHDSPQHRRVGRCFLLFHSR